jgi:hypothetical protein
MELVSATDGKTYQLIVHEAPKPTRGSILANRELFRAVGEVAKHIQGFALDRKPRTRFFNSAQIGRLFNMTIQEKLGAEPAFNIDKWFTEAIATDRAATASAAADADAQAETERLEREKELSAMLEVKLKVDPNDKAAVAAAEKRRRDLSAISTMMASREEQESTGVGSAMNTAFTTHDWYADLVDMELRCGGGFVDALRNSIEADSSIEAGPTHSQLVRHIESYGAVHDRKLPLAAFNGGR